MRADLTLVKATMQRHTVDSPKVSAVITDLQRQIELNTPEKEPTVKKQYVILHTGDTGWVVQIAEEESPATALAKILNAVHTFNASPKGRRMPLKTLGEAMEIIRPAVFKECGIWVKTKLPVESILVDNNL